MTDATTRFKALKDKIDEIAANHERAKGQLDVHLKQIKEASDCDDIPAFEAYCKKLAKEADAAHTKFESALESFENKHEDVLNEF